MKPEKNLFWFQVLEIWCCHHYQNDEDENFLWYNSNIKIENKPFFWTQVWRKGLKWISQLYKNGHALSCKQAYDKFGLTLMQYKSLLSAIPKDLRERFRQVDVSNKQDLVVKAVKPSVIYNELSCNEDMLVAKKRKWESDLNMNIPTDVFLKSFKVIFSVTNNSKLRSFQYRFKNLKDAIMDSGKFSVSKKM